MNNNLNDLYGSKVTQMNQPPIQNINKPGLDKTMILLVILSVLLCIAAGYMSYQIYLLIQLKNSPPIAPVISQPTTIPSVEPTKETVCTMDAKKCPDGSFVGRILPKCEFAQCPAVNPTDAVTEITPTP